MGLEFAIGCVPDPPDARDFLWGALLRPRALRLPPSYRVRTAGPVLEQGEAPRCVAFATATVKMVDEWRERKVWYAFDEPWLYDLCKQRDGKPGREGTNLRVAFKIVQKEGYPARGIYVRARHHPGRRRTFRLKHYVKLGSLREIKQAVKLAGPVAFGIRVDRGIFAPVDGRVPEPSGKPFGGHAMVVTGWDDALGALRIKNSWGYDWGERGFAWLPYSHLDAYRWNAWETVDALGEPI
ncbi:MAG: C1 family peptidase [Gaiellaceae bacterium]